MKNAAMIISVNETEVKIMSITLEKVNKISCYCIPLLNIVPFPETGISAELTIKEEKAAIKCAFEANEYVFLVYAKESGVITSYCETPIITGVLAKIEQTVSSSPKAPLRVLFRGIVRADCSKIYMDEQGLTKTDVLVKQFVYSEDSDSEKLAYIREIRKVFSELCILYPGYSKDIIRYINGENDISLLTDYIGANVLSDNDERNSLLDEYEPDVRASLIIQYLRQELDVIISSVHIRARVQQAMERNQRNFYLREQLAAIKAELGEGEDEDEEIIDYRNRIKALHLAEDAEVKLMKEVTKLSQSPYSSSEASVIRSYLDTVLDIPWGKLSNEETNIEKARRILDADHYGLEKVKQRILEYLAVRKLNPHTSNKIICLLGSPGVGKTSVAASVARATGRKYVRVSLGGVKDESDIRGHRKTYVASMPGRVIDALIKAKTMNPLILFDEIDKMSNDMRGDPASAMLEVLDGEQNKAFRDHFVEIDVDLSDCMFICTANTLDTVPRPLIDRMEVIKLDGYTRDEKYSIARKHLIPKQLKAHGLDSKTFKIDKSAILDIIDNYTEEAGVRILERTICAVMRRAAMRMIDGESNSIHVTSANLGEYLDSHKIVREKVSDRDEVGVVNGLAYTQSGGDLLKIEVCSFPGTGKSELTGSLGDVMKESAQAAISYVRSIAPELDIDPDFYKNRDIHIHVPEGATPKDGPSAGVTIMTAVASELSGRAVRSDVAMTGEITLRGRVLPIGGLREKTAAAYRAGVKTVLIPSANVDDLKDIDPVVLDNLKFVPCSNAHDVLKNALVDGAAR